MKKKSKKKIIAQDIKKNFACWPEADRKKIMEMATKEIKSINK